MAVVNEGFAKNISTVTANRGSSALFFNQRGLMGGMGLLGSKITRIHPSHLAAVGQGEPQDGASHHPAGEQTMLATHWKTGSIPLPTWR